MHPQQCRSISNQSTIDVGNHISSSIDDYTPRLLLLVLLIFLPSVIILRQLHAYGLCLFLLQQRIFSQPVIITLRVLAKSFNSLYNATLYPTTPRRSLSHGPLDIGRNIHVTDHYPVACGSFADVYEATYKGQRVALKRIRISKSLSDEDRKQCYRAFQREVQICAHLNHPHILPICGIDYTTFPMPCIVLPWMAHGDFYTAIKSLKSEQIPGLIPRWLLEVARGIEYLHECSIVHGDLCAPNVLFDEKYHVRVSDFGLSHRPEDRSLTLLSLDRNPRWTAPELLRYEDNATLPYPDTRCDVYSFGCLCIEFYTQKSPFEHLRTYQVRSAVLQGERPPQPDHGSMPLRIWELAQRCWEDAPEVRPCMSEIKDDLENYGIR